MKTIFVDSELSSFEDFHDKEWFVKLFALVEGTDFEDAVEEFSSHWWGASRAFILPWLLVNGVYDSVNNIIPILDKSRQDLWNDYLEIYAFKASLWKTSENAFCSIYYAYENLIVNLLKIILHCNSLRVTDRDFTKKLMEVFGEGVTNKIWNSNFIIASREIRNCIVHNGGKVSPKLLNQKSLPLIENENILISGSDVRILYNNLKLLVYAILGNLIERMSNKSS